MKKYTIREGSIAWWIKDIIGGVLFVGTIAVVGIFMYMIAI